MNKLSLLGLTVALVVCLLASSSQARTVQHDTGRALIDEITGVEVEHVSVPRLATDFLDVTKFNGGRLQATNPAGFQLHTVGGIDVEPQLDATVNVDGEASFQAPGSGDVVFDASDDNGAINANIGESFTLKAAKEAFFSADTVTLDTEAGDFVVDSFLRTSFEALSGIQITSTFRDSFISAPNGHTVVEGNIVNFEAGDSVDDQGLFLSSQGDITVNSATVFSIDTLGDLLVNADRDVSISSFAENVDLRAFDSIDLQGSQIINLKSVNDFIFHAETDVITVSAKNVAGLSAYSVQVQSEDQLTVSGSNSISVVGTGSLVTADATGTSFTTTTSTVSASNNIRVFNDQPLVVTVNNKLTVSSFRLDFSSANLINFDLDNTRDLTLSGTGNGGIEVTSPSLLFKGLAASSTASLTANRNLQFLAQAGYFDAADVLQEGNLVVTTSGLMSSNFVGKARYEASTLSFVSRSDATIGAGTSLDIFSSEKTLFDSKINHVAKVGKDITLQAVNGATFGSKDNLFQAGGLLSIEGRSLIEGKFENSLSWTARDINVSSYDGPVGFYANLDATAPMFFTAGGAISVNAAPFPDQRVLISGGGDSTWKSKDLFYTSTQADTTFNIGGNWDVSDPESFTFQAPRIRFSNTKSDVTVTSSTLKTDLYWRGDFGVNYQSLDSTWNLSQLTSFDSGSDQTLSATDSITFKGVSAVFTADDDLTAVSTKQLNLTPTNSFTSYGGSISLKGGLTVTFNANTITQTTQHELSANTLPSFVGLTTDNKLVHFTTAAPGTTKVVGITGVPASENFVGVDYRPVDNKLYALSNSSKLYTINTATGVATAISAAPFATLISGTYFGVDFNPVADRVRIVSNSGQSLRANQLTGLLAAVDTSLNPGTPFVVAAAYTNSVAGSTSTTLYVIDSVTDSLYLQGGIGGTPSPNGGVLTLVGPLGIDITADAAFEIVPVSNIAYGIFTLEGLGSSSLYRINLSTGAASLVGAIGFAGTFAGLATDPFAFARNTHGLQSQTDHPISFFARDDVLLTASGSTTFTSQNIAGIADSLVVISDASNIGISSTLSRDVDFFAKGSLNSTAATTSTVISDKLAINAEAALAFKADASISLTAGERFNVTSSSTPLFGGDIKFTNSDLHFTGTGDVIFYTTVNNPTVADFTLSSETILFGACETDFVARANEVFVKGTGQTSILVEREFFNCTAETDPKNPFSINSISFNEATYTSIASTSYTAPTIIGRGGDIGFASDNDVLFDSNNAITIATENSENPRLFNPKNTAFDATNGVFDVEAKNAVKIEANGHDSSFGFDKVGVLIHTDGTVAANTFFDVRQEGLRANAENLLFIGTAKAIDTKFLRDPQDVHVVATADALIESGSIQVLSSHSINATEEVSPNTGIQIDTITADFYLAAEKASVYFIAQKTISFETTKDEIVDQAVGDINFSTSDNAADITFTTPFGKVTNVIDQDFHWQSGSKNFAADTTFTTSNNALFETSGYQRYHAYSPPQSDNNNNAIVFNSVEGAITVTAQKAIEIASSGFADFQAQTGETTILAGRDILLATDGQARFNALDSAFVIAETGRVDISAGGFTGRINITSDATQDVNFNAAVNMTVNAAAGNNSFLANSDITLQVANGPILVTNGGDDDNNMLFHSGGNVLLQSQNLFNTQGFSVFGYAKNDIRVDASTVTVGPSFTSITPTNPVVTINAGGDRNLDGFTIDSLGSIEWTTERSSTVSFFGDNIDFSADSGIVINSNGGANFTNSGEDGNGLFIIQTLKGVLSVDGQDNVIVAAGNLNHIESNGIVQITATGTSPSDSFNIIGKRNLAISAPSGTFFSNAPTGFVDVNSRNMAIQAGSNGITFANTVGNGGSLVFDSDYRLTVETINAITLRAGAPILFETLGEDSDFLISTKNGDIGFTSGASLYVQGNTVGVDGANGLSVLVPNGNLEFTSDANTFFKSNSTTVLDGYTSTTISAGNGEANNPLTIQSRGDFTAFAQNELSINAAIGDLQIFGDSAGVKLHNTLADRTRNQGDVTVTSASVIDSISRGSQIVKSSENIVYSFKVIDIISEGVASFVTNGVNANIVTTSSAGVAINAGGLVRVKAGSSAAANLLLQVSGDITVATGSTVDTESKTAHSGTIFKSATGNIQLSSSTFAFSVFSGGEVTATRGPLTINTQTATLTSFNTDVVFRTDGGKVQFSGDTFTSTTTQLLPLGDKRIVHFEGFGNNAISIATNNLVDFNTPHLEFIGSEKTLVEVHGQLSLTSTGGRILFDSTGFNPRTETPGTRNYAIYMETDAAFTIKSDADILIAARKGSSKITAHELLSIEAPDVEFRSSDLLKISSGFVRQPLAPQSGQIGLYFEAQTDVNIVAEAGNVNLIGDAVSFSTGGRLLIRSISNEGTVSFDSNGDLNILSPVTGATGTTIAAGMGDLSFTALRNILLGSADTTNVNIQSQGDIKYAANVLNFQATAINFEVYNGYFLRADNGFVDFQPRGPNDGNNQLTDPQNTLIYSARATLGNDISNPRASSIFEEDEYRACYNRQLHFDVNTLSTCVCINGNFLCMPFN